MDELTMAKNVQDDRFIGSHPFIFALVNFSLEKTKSTQVTFTLRRETVWLQIFTGLVMQRLKKTKALI